MTAEQFEILMGCMGFGFGSVFFAIIGFYLFRNV